VKISVKIDYACRVLAQLAGVSLSGSLLHIEDLAAIEEIPSNYLVQILNDLRHGGLIVSRRGKDGGYALARSPERITLFDIITVVDGDVMEFSSSPVGHSGEKVRQIWTEIKGNLEDKYKSYTLDSLVPRNADHMYYI
jgi:Rrf2 family protein